MNNLSFTEIAGGSSPCYIGTINTAINRSLYLHSPESKFTSHYVAWNGYCTT